MGLVAGVGLLMAVGGRMSGPAEAQGPSTGPDPATISIGLEPVAGGALSRSVAVANAGDGSGRLFVLEKGGLVRIVRDGAIVDRPFLDIQSRVADDSNEKGLLGIAFHPDYAQNGYFYLNYTAGRGNGRTVVARYSVSAEDADRADAGSEKVILTIEQPASNHNGGHVVFGPDGYLYVGTGDGGRAGDPWDNAQTRGVLLGKMLRIDVDVPEDGPPYGIPPTNPFVEDPDTRDEIWALGLRNPWRYGFDPATGDLYIGDVGQNAWEEIDFQAADSAGGENYGWRLMEGTRCYNPANGCREPGLVDPVAEYPHRNNDKSVTGGLVYRGSRFPGMDGLYIYADYASGRFWGLSRDEAGNWRNAEIGKFSLLPAGFGYGEDGEIYIAMDGGRNPSLYRVIQEGVEPVEPTPGGPVATATMRPPEPTPTSVPSDTPVPPTVTPEPTETVIGDWWLYLPFLRKGGAGN
jgi:glucose/arabinose dehydrogenase